MITRAEFYITIGLLATMLIGTLVWDKGSDIERGRIEGLDSILQVQRDSALSRALAYELHADSLQALLNRKKLDFATINKKYETEKKKIITLGADSSLAFFERSIQD